MTKPSQNELEKALNDAGSAHHDYEQVTLNGKYDKLWAGFYAAFVLGRLGAFTTPSKLNLWLEEAPGSENWSKNAAIFILSQLDG